MRNWPVTMRIGAVMFGKKEPPIPALTLGSMTPGEFCEHKTWGKVLVLNTLDNHGNVAAIAYVRKVAVPDQATQSIITYGIMNRTDIAEIEVDSLLVRLRHELRENYGLRLIGRKQKAVRDEPKTGDLDAKS